MTKDLTVRKAQQTLCLTPSVKSLVDVQYKWNYLNGDVVTRSWQKPDYLTHEQHNEILEALERAVQIYPLPTQKWLGGRIATLLSHYYVVSSSQALNTAIASDWLDALQGIPQGFIERAIKQWRNEQTRKPTPADIRILARSIGGRCLLEIERLTELSQLPLKGENNGTDK